MCKKQSLSIHSLTHSLLSFIHARRPTLLPPSPLFVSLEATPIFFASLPIVVKLSSLHASSDKHTNGTFPSKRTKQRLVLAFTDTPPKSPFYVCAERGLMQVMMTIASACVCLDVGMRTLFCNQPLPHSHTPKKFVQERLSSLIISTLCTNEKSGKDQIEVLLLQGK